MKKSILYEANTLSLKNGTGLATYAYQLAETSKSAGIDANILVGVERQSYRDDKRLAEISLYDARGRSHFNPTLLAQRAADWAIGAPLGVRAGLLQHRGIVVDPTSGGRLSPKFETLAVPRLEERTFLHFNRHRRRMKILADRRYDIFHATRPIPLQMAGAANVYTIHDLVPLRLPYATLDNKRHFYHVIAEIVKKADHIVTVSDFTRHDVIDMFNVPEHKITTTWQSVSIKSKYLATGQDEIANDLEQRYRVRYKEYFLFVGAIEPKKNISRMVQAYAASGTAYPLLLAGGLGWLYDRDVESINDKRFEAWKFDGQKAFNEHMVRQLPFLPRGELINLIRGARSVLFPSLYEGFGLPVLEAMLLDTPVVTSKTSSLPEIAGDAAILVDPYEETQIRDAIRQMDKDDDLREDLVKRGRTQAARFSPEQHAKRLLSVYERL